MIIYKEIESVTLPQATEISYSNNLHEITATYDDIPVSPELNWEEST